MTHRIVVRPAAEQDIIDAADWYAAQAPEQVDWFLDETHAVMSRIAESPRLFRAVYRDVRRAALQVFPYLVWFVLDDDVV
ncbi:MAG: type II toxin-antitoxin system RelE/ParE family toxin [Nitriliruptoraceae bacterium]